jgi:hypothetical protein
MICVDGSDTGRRCSARRANTRATVVGVLNPRPIVTGESVPAGVAGRLTFSLSPHQCWQGRHLRFVAARMMLAEQRAPVVVVTATARPKTQWAQAAERSHPHLDPAWLAVAGALPSAMHGVVTTYQQVAINPAAVQRLAAEAFVILDEAHHDGEDRAWGRRCRRLSA